MQPSTAEKQMSMLVPHHKAETPTSKYMDIVLKRKLNRAKISPRLAMNAICLMSVIIPISVESFFSSLSYLHFIIPSTPLCSLAPDYDNEPSNEKQNADVQKHDWELPQIQLTLASSVRISLVSQKSLQRLQSVPIPS
jgi:hypothetical protein